MTTRDTAIARATAYYDSGAFLTDLRRRVAYPTVSQPPTDTAALRTYLVDELAPAVTRLGATARIIDNPTPEAGPLLLAHRHEADHLPTVLVYGHADVVPGQDDRWRTGLSPWHLVVEDDRLYGRGTADNKGQHTVNIAALEQVLTTRGSTLGFNLKFLMETGEESGSPGLHEFCRRFKDDLTADLLIASDGPRLAADRPTLFLGSRGAANLRLRVPLRDGAHHSGNWGGALRNPATVLAAALATMVDARGRILVEGLRPPAIPEPVRAALADLTVGGGEADPTVDTDWGEPHLTPAERVFAWNTLEILTLSAGDPAKPVGAIPGTAHADIQLRFVVGTDWQRLEQTIRAHLDAHALPMVEVDLLQAVPATRLDPDSPWVHWATTSLHRTTGKPPAILPNLGGTLPNDAFADILALPTIWIPHSHPSCRQHAPDEHLLGSVAREGLGIMAGLFWDLGEPLPEACRT
ncbi:M20 family metallopeptidase [Streptomyces sp. NL15-2K]|uniref:M20 family metallopeptidase n=1 Tax=Streptomyces sp. NL15-2K TaxID=376149 RepID=UPI000F58E446|nr:MULTISPECIES: M20 family metallopeptidase [Actinomycetes]WKX09057.1 M20 family metallopeptidase [Kutzneria buriramensis]GCB49445.1 acetylornithine deacetylase/succinyl-diaminopimelate desuccinylase and related deacylases [Streptomyces sp. NL15-2K]